MSGKIEISRELAERIALIFIGLGKLGIKPSCAEELRTIIAAPVVERQPVTWIKHLKGAECKSDGRTYDIIFCAMPGYTPLFASPPAPVLPERIDTRSHREEDHFYMDGWNACIDKVKELNQ